MFASSGKFFTIVALIFGLGLATAAAGDTFVTSKIAIIMSDAGGEVTVSDGDTTATVKAAPPKPEAPTVEPPEPSVAGDDDFGLDPQQVAAVTGVIHQQSRGALAGACQADKLAQASIREAGRRAEARIRAAGVRGMRMAKEAERAARAATR